MGIYFSFSYLLFFFSFFFYIFIMTEYDRIGTATTDLTSHRTELSEIELNELSLNDRGDETTNDDYSRDERFMYDEDDDENTENDLSARAHYRGGGNKHQVINKEEDEYFGSGNIDAKANIGSNDEVIIDIKNIHKTYLLGVEGVAALRGVSLSIKRGEFVCIFGTSGGGKTSLLNIIGTIDKPTKGELSICGTKINSKTTDKQLAKLRLTKLGFVFQTFNLLSALTARENVEMPMILHGTLNSAQRKQRSTELLSNVGMKERMGHVPSMLSGGEQQRVTIARALANQPDILLLDEPTGDLDSGNTLIVMKQLIELNKKQNITLVMVTHDMGLKYFADRVIWMRDGKIQRVETVPDYKQKESFDKLERELKELRENDPKFRTGNEKWDGRFRRTTIRKPTDYDTHMDYVNAVRQETKPKLEE